MIPDEHSLGIWSGANFVSLSPALQTHAESGKVHYWLFRVQYVCA